MEIEELSRLAVRRFRESIFSRYTEKQLRVFPGSVREEYVTRRSCGHRQPLGKLVWEMLLQDAHYRVIISHDGDAYFSILVMRSFREEICCLVNATFDGLPSKVRYAIDLAIDPTIGKAVPGARRPLPYGEQSRK